MYIHKVDILPIIVATFFVFAPNAESTPQSEEILSCSPSTDQTSNVKPPLDFPPISPPSCPPFFPPPFPPPSLSTTNYLPILLAVLSSDLALTEHQLEALHDLKDKLIEKSQPIAVRLLIRQHEMSNLLTKSNIDKTDVKQIQQEIIVEDALLSNLLADHVLAVMQVLTPDQRKMARIECLHRELGLFEERLQHLR